MKLTTMDKAAAQAIRAELDKVLPGVGRALGIEAHARNAKYDPISGSCTFSVEFKLLEVAGGKSREQQEWEGYCEMFGFKPEHFGKTFRSGRGTVTICGLDLKRRTRPIIAMDEQGKRFIFKAEDVLKQLEKPALVQRPAPERTRECGSCHAFIAAALALCPKCGHDPKEVHAS